MRKNHFITIIVITILLIGVFFFFARNHTQKQNKPLQSGSAQISVVTTLFPLYDFAKNIGGDHVNVTLLLPPGVEAHTFEPTPHDMIAINESDLFVYTGEFMEPWAEDMLNGTNNANFISVDTSAGITLAQAMHEEEQHHDESSENAMEMHQEQPTSEDHASEIHEEEHTEHNTITDHRAHHHGNFDPHIWLDFDNAQKMVDTITATLIQKDPLHANEYRSNANNYKEKLKTLDRAYTTSLTNCASREIVYGGHYAFGYLSKKYDLSYEAAYGISPDAEPSAHDLALLIEQVKKDHSTTIFYEELLSPKVAETIAKETGAQLRMLNPAHNLTKEEYENGKTFIMIMENNLQNLTYGLSCK